MTRKRIGAGLLEAFSETCDHCKGRGVIVHTEPVAEKRATTAATQVKAVAAASRSEPQSGRSRRRRGADTAADEPVLETAGPAAVVAEVPPDAGSGIVMPAPQLSANEADDDYDISGYDLSRYESDDPADPDGDAEPLQLTGADDPDAADEDDDVVGAGAGGRRRSRRGGARRRTRP
jgi:ribonuclease E